MMRPAPKGMRLRGRCRCANLLMGWPLYCQSPPRCMSSPRTLTFRRWLRATIAFLLLFTATDSRAQVTRDFALDLAATPSPTPPHLTLTWTQRQQAAVTGQKLYRRVKGGTTWPLTATLPTADTSYADPTAAAGVEYEYWLERTYTGLSPSRPIGYLSAGFNVPAVEYRGTVLLVIDNTMFAVLAPEIATLTDDLMGDGWSVQTIPALRTDTPANVKLQIKAAYNADPTNVKAVYLLGHVPVPYSGVIAPDGHGDHIGAWPADGYYGDMDGVWTDATANNTSASSSRNYNIPGDGKFDQSSLPSDLELQVGRVDLSGMTQAPAAVVNETTLLRRYLRKAHAFRHRLGAYVNVPRRSMLRDGFGYFGGESFASSGWAAALSSVGGNVDLPLTGQWFTQAASDTYLFGYGNGGGSYTSASSVGTSTDFGRLPSRVVFTLLFGSYHGDWDSANNFMRAPLAGTATGDSLGLTCYWSGRAYFFMHPAGLGDTIGYAARLSMNNNGGSYTPSNGGRGVHAGLMGDPTLRLHMVEPPRNLAATASAGSVTLRWDASTETELLGYHVYRATGTTGAFSRLTTTPLTLPGFTDATPAVGSGYRYLVRTLKLELVPGGSYQNLSQGVFATITASAAATAPPFNPSNLAAQTISSNQVWLSWTDNSPDETGFRIERRVGVGGSFSLRATVAANVTSFTDVRSLTDGVVYYYRVVANGTAGSSLPSDEAAADAAGGFLDLTAARLKVNRSAGTAVLQVNRFGGNSGASSVTGTTSDVSAIAGIHYTNATGPVSFADGESGTRTINVTVTTGTPAQLPRQFNYTLSAPTGFAPLAQQTVTRVLIEDPAATLPAPWTQVILGTVTDSSAAVFAENAIGSAVAGGSATTTDNGRFIHQSRTGDGVITAFIDAPLPLQANARSGLMIRGLTASDAPMASAQIAGTNVGTNLATRSFTDGNIALLPGSNNNLLAPRWVRLTRSGNTFTAETSTDGGAWDLLGTTTITLPTAALWGLYHHGDTSGNFQLARFRYVTITDIGALPAPTRFTLTPQAPAQIQLAWDQVGGATSYEVERRPRNGAFAPVQTIPAGAMALNDTVLPGVVYDYRIRAVNSSTTSAWVQRNGTSVGTPTPYQSWLQANGLPMDASANGAPNVSIANDGIWNAMKFSLGLTPQTSGYAGRVTSGTVLSEGQIYNSLTYTRPEPPPAGNVYSVRVSSDLSSWSGAEVLETSSTVGGGFRTITTRDTVPAHPSTPRRFIRLEVLVP